MLRPAWHRWSRAQRPPLPSLLSPRSIPRPPRRPSSRTRSSPAACSSWPRARNCPRRASILWRQALISRHPCTRPLCTRSRRPSHCWRSHHVHVSPRAAGAPSVGVTALRATWSSFPVATAAMTSSAQSPSLDPLVSFRGDRDAISYTHLASPRSCLPPLRLLPLAQMRLLPREKSLCCPTLALLHLPASAALLLKLPSRRPGRGCGWLPSIPLYTTFH